MDPLLHQSWRTGPYGYPAVFNMPKNSPGTNGGRINQVWLYNNMIDRDGAACQNNNHFERPTILSAPCDEIPTNRQTNKRTLPNVLSSLLHGR